MAKGKEARRGKKEEKPKEEPKPEAVKEEPKEAVPEVKEEKKKEKKEKKSQKERPKSKKKHTKIQVWKLYEIKENKATRKNESCPRCGPGTFLASYKNRKYCGKCGFAEIKGEKK
jgi:small subunit ribosomal protein S27Ae